MLRRAVAAFPPEAPPGASDPARQLLIEEARRQGFCSVGVGGLEPFARARERALAAVNEGRLEGMPWFTKERVEQSADLRRRFPWGRSLVAFAYPYRPAMAPLGQSPDLGPGRGRIAAYAIGEDYHRQLDRAVQAVVRRMRAELGELRCKRFVDHGWALDRAIAERSGLGFSGKHTQLITLEHGSYVLLAAAVLSLPLAPDPPSDRNCGQCQACIPACPTGALISPGVMDARRCISYLTIEHQGPIPRHLRHLIGAWVFGCDLCQEACPINQRLTSAPLPPGPARSTQGAVPYPDLVELLELSEERFQSRFEGTTLLRSGRARLARNAAIALGNLRPPAATAALARSLAQDPSPMVRGASAWALGQLLGPGPRLTLRTTARTEVDPVVRDEIETALEEAEVTLPAMLGCSESA